MAVDTEYGEDAQRIERDYVRPSSTTRDDVEEDLKNADFNNAEEVAEWILTDEDVGGAALEPHVDGVTTREEIESAVDEADGVGYSDGRREAVTSEIASDVGAPTSSELQNAQFSAIRDAEQVTPEGGSTSVSLIEGPEGEPVAAIGGGSSAGPQVAEEQGVEHYSSPQQFNDSLTSQPAPDGSRALLYTNDGADAVGEVNLE